jgi:hypothetical protein
LQSATLSTRPVPGNATSSGYRSDRQIPVHGTTAADSLDPAGGTPLASGSR